MSTVNVTFIQPDGQSIVVDGEVGESVMEAARSNGVEGILADCGGSCACATCHVLVPEEWQEVVGAPDDIEDMTLDMAGDVRQENSRLCCQIKISPEMDGLTVTVSPVDF